MKVCRILQSLALSFALLAMSAFTVGAAVPVTTNLLVNLNGDSTSNFLASGDAVPAVQVWKDLAEDGSDASQQDFGQAIVTKQPGLLANTAVPNSVSTGISYNVLD